MNEYFANFSMRRIFRLLGLVFAITAIGCTGIEKAPPRPRPARVDKSKFQINAPQIMRGTVASQTILDGYRPVVVHGYGIIVGLNGTGSRDLPPDVRSYMIQESSRHGVGQESAGYGQVSPERFLDSMDTAVVIVEALIPPGATKGTHFDVRVIAHPLTSTTSLEGGLLYTADLRPALGRGLPPTGSRQAAAIALARGEVFINPFAEPGSTTRDTIERRGGRILDGGVLSKDINLKLRLATPSHATVASLQQAINTRFPQERNQRKETAHGESDEAIEINVPPSYQDSTEEFIQLLMHTSIRQAGPESIAGTVRRHLLAHPSSAVAASWRWQAIGPRALPVIRDLYDYPEELPRLAALRAAARLSDPYAAPHLIDMAEKGSGDVRLQAIALLADMGSNPLIDRTLHNLLNDEDVEIRLAAYEGLLNRGSRFIDRISVDGKFTIDVVASDIPMLYVTQIGKPRLAVFGPDLAITQPITASAWSNRFIVKDLDDETLEVYYRSPSSQKGSITKASPTLYEFLFFLGHTSTVADPRAGLGFSYGETMGVIHQIWRQGYLKADFKAEQDRILAAIMRQRRDISEDLRPEFVDINSEGIDFPLEEKQLDDVSELQLLDPVTLGQENDQHVTRKPRSPK